MRNEQNYIAVKFTEIKQLPKMVRNSLVILTAGRDALGKFDNTGQLVSYHDADGKEVAAVIYSQVNPDQSLKAVIDNGKIVAFTNEHVSKALQGSMRNFVCELKNSAKNESKAHELILKIKHDQSAIDHNVQAIVHNVQQAK